jgi:signal transduction histidine kinase
MVADAKVRRIRSLRLRFVLAIATLVALVLVANSLVLALANRPHLREDLENRAQAYARLSTAQVCNAYETYYASGYSKFREIVQDKMQLEPDLARLAIYDTGGRVLFDSRELGNELGEPGGRVELRQAPAPAGERLLAAVQGMAPSAWQAEDGRAYRVVAPYVEEWGRHRYSVAFTFSYDSLRLAALAAGWRIFWLSAGSLALGVAIAILLAAQSVGPIEVLTRGAQDIADGHLSRRIELATGDEFGVLAATFNQMAEKLARTISDLETSNRTLGQMNLDLQQMDRMKSDLLANVSHELRTPLTAIQGYTEAMDEGLLGEVTVQQRDAFKVVQRNSRRLMGMIDQLLAFSRLDAPDALGSNDAGGARFEPAAFDLAEVAAQVVGSVRAGSGAARDLRLEVPPGEGGLPPVWGDPGRIAQVLENLVTNAVKFTPAGGEIRVRLSRCGEEAEVAVADRGIGIPAAARERIFERFYQVDTSSTRAYGGMGLGLAIVREILAAHGREIRVESVEGKGTTFRFTLPLAGIDAGRVPPSRLPVGEASKSSPPALTALAQREAGGRDATGTDAGAVPAADAAMPAEAAMAAGRREGAA